MNLQPLPEKFQYTRDQLHQVAFYALAPARYRAVGRMGLRATPGGFGTPEFHGKVARVEDDLLVHQSGGNTATQAITTIRSAAEFFGIGYERVWFTEFHDPLPAMDPDRPLDIDLDSARALARWFRFGFEVLEEQRARARPEDQASEVQLWPEHFDPATEIGDEGGGRRASYGASPGDGDHIGPYLYVAAWSEVDRSEEYWNDRFFDGASLSYRELAAAEDSMAAALDFFDRGYRLLHSD